MPQIGEERTLPNGVKVAVNQPQLVTGGVLRSYQLDGLEWLKVVLKKRICLVYSMIHHVLCMYFRVFLVELAEFV